MEINTRALTSHSKHNGSRMKYYAYNLTIPNYRISSNNSRGQEPQWLLSGAIISFFAHKGGDYSREGDHLRERLFQILLTGSRALNILFITPLNKKIIISSKLNMGFLSVPNLVP